MDPIPEEQRSLAQTIFISPGEPRPRAGWRLLLHTLLLGVILFILGLIASQGLGFLNQITYGAFILLGTLVTSLAITFSVYLARRYLDRRSFSSLGLTIDRQALVDISFGFGLTGLMMSLIFVILWALNWVQIESFAWQVEGWGNITASIVTMTLLFSFVSWQEELLFRGYWLQNLSNGLTQSLGVLLSSAVFALFHWFNPNLDWLGLAGLFLAGLFMAFGYLRTRQLWLPIGLHLGWNLFEGTLFGFPVSGQYQYQLIRQTVTGPDLITGGAFGPEAGLILLPVLVFGTAGIYWYSRSRFPVSSERRKVTEPTNLS
jgi:membrane protease YdiL (CAAX protease family)